MKITFEIDLQEYLDNRLDDYECEDRSVEEYIIEQAIKKASLNLANTIKQGNKDRITKEFVEHLLKTATGELQPKFEEMVESKVNRSNVTSKINKKIENLTDSVLVDKICRKVNFEDLVSKEVRKIMNEKFK